MNECCVEGSHVVPDHVDVSDRRAYVRPQRRELLLCSALFSLLRSMFAYDDGHERPKECVARDMIVLKYVLNICSSSWCMSGCILGWRVLLLNEYVGSLRFAYVDVFE